MAGQPLTMVFVTSFATSTSYADVGVLGAADPLVYVRGLVVANLDASIDMLITLDTGTTEITVPAGQSVTLPIPSGHSVPFGTGGFYSLQIKSASGTPSAECYYSHKH